MFILFRQAHSTVDDEDGRRRRRRHASVLRLIFFFVSNRNNVEFWEVVVGVGCGNATIANVFAHGMNTCPLMLVRHN